MPCRSGSADRAASGVSANETEAVRSRRASSDAIAATYSGRTDQLRSTCAAASVRTSDSAHGRGAVEPPARDAPATLARNECRYDRSQPGQRLLGRRRREPGRPSPRAGVGDLPVPYRPEAQHAPVGRRVDRLPPARPQLLERGHAPLDRPRPDLVRERGVHFVDGERGVGQHRPDAGHDLVQLRRLQPHRRVEAGQRPRHRRQRAGPPRQVPGGQQVHGAARAEGLDQLVGLPQRGLHVRRGPPPASRCPTDSSPAVRIWACTPQTAAATSATEDKAVAPRWCRASRRALIADQVGSMRAG